MNATRSIAGARRAARVAYLLIVWLVLLWPALGPALTRTTVLVSAGLVAAFTPAFLRGRWPLVPLLVGACVLVRDPSQVEWQLGAALFVFGLGAAHAPSCLASRSVALAAAIHGALWIATRGMAEWMPAWRGAWATWSEVTVGFHGLHADCGPSAMGAWFVVPLALALIARFAVFERRPRKLAVSIGVLLSTSVLVLAVVARTTSFHDAAAALWRSWGVALTIAVPLAAALLSRGSARFSEPNRVPRTKAGAALAAAAALLAGVAALGPLVEAREAPRVLIYADNRGPVLNFDVPEYGNYGPYSLGMLGLLVRYLEADGCEVELHEGELRGEDLANRDLLITINVNTEWKKDELLAVWSFVDSGGGLLVIGDHTNVEGSRGPQNELLAPTGVRLRFDSAYPYAKRGWESACLFRHQALSSLEWPSDSVTAIGASLELGSKGAQPLLVGRATFSDWGDVRAPERAFLGNYRYDPGERLGDLVLAAWARLGEGRVVVLGDSSGFQNAPIDGSYETFVRGVVGFASGRGVLDLGPAPRMVCGLLAILACLCAVVVTRGSIVIALVALILQFAVSSSVVAVQAALIARPELDAPTALIDLSHLPRIESGANAARSLDGLRSTLNRSEYRTRTMRRFDAAAIASSEVFVTIAPKLPYTEQETDVLDRFMQSGGVVIAAASFPDKQGIASHLARLGLDVTARPIGPIPLERIPGRVRTRVEYTDAWEVSLDAERRDQEHAVYDSYGTSPLSIFVRRGRGGYLLVGDSGFFGASNLESMTDFSEPNLLFLRSLLQDVRDLSDSNGERG